MIAAARSRAPPSPAPTPAPPPLLVPEPNQLGPLQKRQQQVAPDNPDYPQCTNVPNYQLSCWPTENIAVLQNKWYHFVWNSRFITYVQNGMVDVYLYQADSNLPVTNWTRQWTADGWLAFQVDDDWWGPRGLDWTPGKNQTIPFYFVVVESGHTFVGGEPKEPTFYAIQTGPVAAAVSASLSAAHSALVASSSRAAATVSSTATQPALQNNNVDQSFPSWAIALLVVLGVLAFVSLFILAFLLLRSARRKRAKRRRSLRSSMGSASPMMAGIVPQSPVATTIGAPVRQSTATSYPHHDAASSTSHAHSSDVPPPISTDDAAFVANAFRRGLRNPDFSGRPIEEGESPEQKDQPPGSTEGNERLTRELAEEGRGLRSVSSERGVRVQTLSDEEGTVLPAR